jgi:putative peptidoglycan lipid II flippase
MAKHQSLIKSFATVSSWTLVSRVLGFVRDMQMAAILGASPLSDAFLVAFKLPNFFRKLFAEGAFNAAFVPLFSGTLASEGKDVARQFAREALSALTFVLLVFSALAMLAMPWITNFMAPGFDQDPEKFATTVELSRITFPYLLFISITSLLVGVLNSMDKFAAGAAAPILLNLCFIIGLGFFAQSAETPAHAAAWAVFAAGVAQCLMLLWCVRRAGMWPAPALPRFTPRVKQLLLLMGPATIGSSVAQISLFIDVILASSIPQAVSYLYYADRVNEFPLGIIGIAIGTAVLPLLSRQWRLGETQSAQNTQNRALELAFFFSTPATVALMVIGLPIVSVLFEHGQFTAEDSRMTSYAMFAYAAGLPAFVAVKILLCGFFANRDTKTPVKIAGICVASNIALNIALIELLKPYGIGHVGLAAASAITGWMNACLLAYGLHKRGMFAPDARLFSRLWRQLLAALVMAAVLYGVFVPLEVYFTQPHSKWERMLALIAMVAAGFAAFAVAATLLKAIRWSEIKNTLRRKKKPDQRASAE